MRHGTTAHAAVWAFAATAGTRVITLASLAVLARLLSPEAFGLLAFALVYITYAETVGDLGTAMALIYWPDRRDDAAQLTFLVNLAMGLGWCLLTLALAPLIADFFNRPEAAAIVRVLAVAFVVKYLGTTHDALAQKDLRFRARAVPELALALVKAGIAIALAAAGFGAWSLVWGHLAGLTAWTVGAWVIVPWRPHLGVPRGLLGPMLRYGQGIVGVNVIAAVVHHADLVVVGRMLGAYALGLYQIAYKIPEASVTVVLWVVSKVLFPSFARLRHAGQDLRRAYLDALRWVSLVTIPMAAGLFVAAEPLVLAFFGRQWAEAAPLLRWLALYIGLRSLGTHAGDVLKATGRTGLLAGLGLVKGAVLVPALVVAGGRGVREVAMAMALVTLLTSALNVVIAQRLLRFTARELGRALAVSLAAGAALVAVGLALARLSADLPPVAALAVLVPACAVVYVGSALALDRSLVAELRHALGRGGDRPDVLPEPERESP